MAKENFPYQLFTVGEEYSRNDINKRLTHSVVSQQSGVTNFYNGLVLFVTLEKKGRKKDIQYKDFFRGKKEFFWESQSPNSPYGTPQKPLISKLLKGELNSYLYVRIEEKTKSKTNPFIYCGSLEVESYDDQANGQRPFGVKFLCRDMPDNLNSKLHSLIEWVPKNYSINFSFKEVINLASSFLVNDQIKIKKLKREISKNIFLRSEEDVLDFYIDKVKNNGLSPSPYHLTDLLERFGRFGLNEEFFFPKYINDFINELIRDQNINSILDPSMKIGNLLYGISKKYKINNICGYSSCPLEYDLAKLFLPKSNLKNEYFPDHKNNEKFDLIVSSPPFVVKTNKNFRSILIDGNSIDIFNHKESEIIFSSLKNLSEDGIALFIVSPSFLIQKEKRDIFDFIKKIGFSIEAIFHIPRGGFKPLTGIATRILVIKKGKYSKHIFEGELSFNMERDKQLIENFKYKRQGSDPSLGVNTPSNGGTSLKQIIGMENLFKCSVHTNIQHKCLDEFAEKIIYPTDESIEMFENSIFISLVGNNDIYEFAYDIDPKKLKSGIRTRSLAQVVIDPKKINKRTLVRILQSKRGQLAFKLFTSENGFYIPLRCIGLLTIFIPEKKKQDKLEDIDRKIHELKYQLSYFENNLWDRVDTPEISEKQFNNLVVEKPKKNQKVDKSIDISILPFPLASILWTVKSFKGTPIKEALHIEFFFEALSQYLATYIMSGYYKNEQEFYRAWEDLSSYLQERNQSIDISNFGTWNIIFSQLTKKIKKDIKKDSNSQSIWMSRLAINSEQFFINLIGDKLFGILMKASKLRNIWRGHTGAYGDEEATKRFNTYYEMVIDVLSLFGNEWIESPLVIPSTNRYKEGSYNYNCQLAMGYTTPLERKEFVLKNPLEDGMLHVISKTTGESCKLLPLIRFGESPHKNMNACYFYSRKENNEQRWVSYHYENQPTRLFNIPEVTNFLNQLRDQ